MSDPRIRTLKIKTGVVKRLAKEKVTYEKEAAQQRDRIQTFKDQGKIIIIIIYFLLNFCFFV